MSRFIFLKRQIVLIYIKQSLTILFLSNSIRIKNFMNSPELTRILQQYRNFISFHFMAWKMLCVVSVSAQKRLVRRRQWG